MNFWLLALILIILHGTRFLPEGQTDGMDRDMSVQWRGIFTLLITMTHFMLYFPYTAIPGNEQMVHVWNWLDQLVVVPFLFFNGYGTAVSVRKKGWTYARGLVTRKMPSLYVRYALATLIVVLVHAAMNLIYTPGAILMALTGWTHFYHDDQWYIVMLLAMYAIMFLARLPFRWLRLKGRKADCFWAALVTLGCLALVWFVRRHGKLYYWYDTMIALPIGLWWGLLHEDITALLKDGFFYGLFLFACLFSLTAFYAYRADGLVNQYLMVTCFCLLIPVLSMKVRFSSPILAFYGRHSLPVYLLMRIPMIILQWMGLVYSEPGISFLFVLMGVTVLAQLFDRITSVIQSGLDRLADKLEVVIK